MGGPGCTGSAPVSLLTAQKRNRLFSYERYVEIMSQGTELPER
jgi:hypothetical protein